MRQGFGRFLLPADAIKARCGPLPGLKIQPGPAIPRAFHRGTAFPQKIMLDQGPIYHIKGAIGGKVKGRPEGHEPSGIDRSELAFSDIAGRLVGCVSDFLD
jgi:hypothetical protein